MSAGRRLLAAHCLATAAGLLADRRLGDPADRWHPAVVFGRAMQAAEERLYADDGLRGALHVVAGLGLAGAAACALERMWPARERPIASTLLATYVAVAGRELADAALEVGAALSRHEVDDARALLPALIRPDPPHPQHLDAVDLSRAVIEAVAEKTVDVVVAPAMWAALAGAHGVLLYRATSAMDAVVGQQSLRYRRYGMASARLDDIATWVPARLCAVLVALARPQRAAEVWRTVRAAETGCAAAFAGALGLHLGEVNPCAGLPVPHDDPGRGRTPEPADVYRAVALSRDVTLLLSALLGAAFAVAGRVWSR